MSKQAEAMKLALEAAYLAGWNASGEGYNAEYPFGDHARNPEEDAVWVKDRDNALREALAAQPAMPFVPDAIHHTDTSEPLMYIQGWNDCRQAVLAEQPAQRQEPVVTARQLSLATRQWDHWKAYALELQERLVKYEGGAPMVLNTSPPTLSLAQRKPLTDEQIRDIHWSKPMDEYAFARAIEYAHGIKENT